MATHGSEQAFAPGDAYHLWNPSAQQNHIHVVLTSPEPHGDFKGEVVALVNVTSMPSNLNFDRTTILEPGTHPRISHRSYVIYRYAQLKLVSEILDELKSGLGSRIEPFSDEELERICDGVDVSDLTPDEIRDWCFERMPVWP